MRKTVLILVIFCVNCLPVLGWGQKGHDVVAHIAEKHLTGRTKKAVAEILEAKSMVYYSSWIDNLFEEYSKHWITGWIYF